MAVNADLGHQLDRFLGFRAGSPDFVNDRFPAEHCEDAADRNRDNQGNNLISGESGNQGRDGKEGKANQEAPEVSRKDGLSVGVAEVNDGPDHGEGEEEGEGPNEGAGEELADDGAAKLDREGSEELDGAGVVLIGPLAHADRRNKDHEEERVVLEERAIEAGVADPPKVPNGESEKG